MAAIIVLVALSMLAIGVVQLRARRNGRERMACERRYRKIVSQVQEAILVAEAGSGRIVVSNATLQRPGGFDAGTLLKNADIARCQAKEAGRNNLQFFLSDVNVQLSETVALEQAPQESPGTRPGAAGALHRDRREDRPDPVGRRVRAARG